jgi:hypothetical protein
MEISTCNDHFVHALFTPASTVHTSRLLCVCLIAHYCCVSLASPCTQLPHPTSSVDGLLRAPVASRLLAMCMTLVPSRSRPPQYVHASSRAAIASSNANHMNEKRSS